MRLPIAACSLVGWAVLFELPLGVLEAQATRAVVLVEYESSGQPRNQANLDAAASAALQRAGVRVMDLDVSRRTQRAALAKAVEAGAVLADLGPLQADVLVGLRLSCAEGASKVLGSRVASAQCSLATKVLHLSGGDLIYAESTKLVGHGLNPALAEQNLISGRLSETIELDARKWLSASADVSSWEADLTVTRLTDNRTARALAERLSRAGGVGSAKLILYDRGLAKYTVSGRGGSGADGLAQALDGDPSMCLSISHESHKQLYAEFDLAKANRQPIMVMSTVPSNSDLNMIAAELLRASVMNLPYFEMAHTMPLVTSPEDARLLETRLRNKGRELRVPLLLAASLGTDANGWIGAVKLVETESGRTLAASSAAAADGPQALDRAIRALDDNYRNALSEPEVRVRLGLHDLAADGKQSRLVIHEFAPPTAAAKGVTGQVATLQLYNASTEVVADARLTLSARQQPLGEQTIPDLPAGTSLTLSVPLDTTAIERQGVVVITASIEYRSDGGYSRVSAFSSWLSQVSDHDLEGEDFPSAPKRYREAIARAVARYREGAWTEARESFLRAHEILPNARTFRALGMVELDLGNVQSARRHLNAALAAGERPLTSSQRFEVRRLLARVELSDPLEAKSVAAQIPATTNP